MGEIRLLDPTVANQIAAGEVVTRPAAVVKELLENAVDASARNITLRLSQSGEALICVTDDGCGIPSSQIPLAFARHATSKIRTSQDIFRINTLGFRGEALASIASVAEVEMKSRTPDSETGTKVLVRECSILSTEEVSMPAGTSISVYNLFYNTPARRKFLKSESYEKRLCLDEFEHVALANPSVGFTLQNDNMPPTVYPACSLHDRVAMIAKKKVAENLFPVSLESDILRLEGWIASPQCQVQGSRDMYFFVNGRYMNPRLLYRAVNAGYGRTLPEGKCAPCYLYMEVDPESIDVNVHPTKAEIKFDNEREICELVRTAVRRAVGTAFDVPELDFSSATEVDIPLFRRSDVPSPSAGGALKGYNPFDMDLPDDRTPDLDSEAENIPFREDLPSGLVLPSQDESRDARFTPVSADIRTPSLFTEIPSAEEASDMDVLRLHGRFFAVRNASGLAVIHWSRAQERIEYERIMDIFSCGCTAQDASQRLLVPETVSLSVTDAMLILEKSEMLAGIGFEIGDLGSGTLAVYAVPASMDVSEGVQKFFDDVASQLSESASLQKSGAEKTAAAVARTFSSRRSVPTDEELRKIAADLFRCSAPMITPSSSLSTMWVIPSAEIDKHFKR